MDTNDRYLHRIATDIEHLGMGAVESDITRIVERANRAGLCSPAVSVLADRTAPEIARARAFGIVTTRLARIVERAPAPVPAGVTR